MPKAEELSITCSKADDRGRRLVVTVYGKQQHRNTFDPDAGFQRKEWRAEVIKFLGVIPSYYCSSGDSAEVAIHTTLEEMLQVAVEAADAEPTSSLWQPDIVNMSDLETTAVEWLWPGYFSKGAISNLAGDPGLGKSQATCDLGARITRGWAMPPTHSTERVCRPRGVLYLNGEDDLARVMRPRLLASGADLSKVTCLRSMKCSIGEEEERPVSIPTDLPAIERLIRERDIALVVIDPLTAFFDANINANADADVRRCLSPVATVAEATGAAFLHLRHLNKKPGVSAVYRGGGSIAITAAARAEYMIGADPSDPNSRVMACVKNNLAIEPSSLGFHIETHGDTSRVCWGETCDTSAADLCAHGSDKRRGGKTDQAKDIISELLADGPRGSNEVLQACLDAGLSERTYHTARKALGVKSEKTGFNDGQWLLTMPCEFAAFGEF